MIITPDHRDECARLRLACHWARIRHPAFAQVLAPAQLLRPAAGSAGLWLHGQTLDGGRVEVRIVGRQVVATLTTPAMIAEVRATLPARLLPPPGADHQAGPFRLHPPSPEHP